MNSNPEVVRLCNNNQRHMAHTHCATRWYDRDGVDTQRQNRRLNIERHGKEHMELVAQRRQERIAAKQRDLHNIPQLDRDREVIDNQLDAQQINLDDNQNV
ncbi:2538_t:CDS:2 [Dentiscutata erythropus]|uniref:2538_t:CDS:1 n=1 Tax=Dentiscutata erythropus TaxID=1348616 RepID=A0A9N9K6T0_9GLOM|nr:2538_t:CDS:2 [Dentiscutata erythropus]